MSVLSKTMRQIQCRRIDSINKFKLQLGTRERKHKENLANCWGYWETCANMKGRTDLCQDERCRGRA